MDADPALVPPSPTNSSVSSSDLDTESTGSFFPDHSTTLGTLMGVTFPPNSAASAAEAPARVPSRAAAAAKKPTEGRRQRRRRGSWWRLCRDDMVGPTSLGDFLQIERSSAGTDVAAAAAAGFFVAEEEEHVAVGGGRLFENGRMLPPAPPPPAERRRRERGPLLLAGICNGGAG